MMLKTDPQDPTAAVTHPDPYPFYAALVAERPLYFDDRVGSWVASSAHAVSAVLASELCGVRPAAEHVPSALRGSVAGDLFGKFVRTTDGESHQIRKAALARAIASIGESAVVSASEKCARLLLRSHSPPPEFAYELPTYVMAALLGTPDGDLALVNRLVQAFAGCLAAAADEVAVEHGSAAAVELKAYFSNVLAEHAKSQPGGLYAAIVRELQAVGSENDGVAAANAVGFIFQSRDATAGLIGNGLLALSTRCELRSRVTAERAPARSFVAEVARFDSPVQNTRRYVNRGGAILGRSFKPGDVVLVLLAAANRDPAANERPDEFIVDREERRTFTFGDGSHACPGAQFAMSIAADGIEATLRSGADVSDLARDVRYRPSPNVRIPIFAARG
jgi:cytochrome P450